jgi:N-acetylglucosaminyl-diphospho-decaprenol L-rhamnosyltransferase
MSRLSVVVVSHNSRADLERSLPAVVGGGREVVVVDNASTDDSRELVRDRFGTVRLLELRENVGYGAACNEGLRAVRAPLVLLLNPDAWPLADGIERLAECAVQRPRLGAVAPQLHTQDGRQQQTFVGFPTRWWRGRPPITSVPRRQLRGRANGRPRHGFLVGAALLVRREAIEEVGGFDPTFFMFYEEVDLCWRLQEAGWAIDVCSQAKFVHVGGASTRQSWARMYREQLRGHLRFLSKHHGVAAAEQARRYLSWALRMRLLVGTGPQRQAYREAAAWLASGPAALLLDDRERTRQRHYSSET